MLTLDTTKTINGSAGTAAAVTYTITGDEVNTSTGTDSLKQLAQGQLTTSASTPLYTVPSTTATIVKQIILANTTGSAVTATFYIGGSAAANLIFSLPIPANGGATIDDSGYKVYGSSGNVLTTGTITLTGDVTGSGTSPVSTTISSSAVTNAKMANMANLTVKGNTSGSPAAPSDLTQTQLTTLINPATTTLSGALAATDYQHIPSGWIDVTRQGANSLSTGASGSANNTALAAIMAAAPSGSVLYFPPGWYTFASTITIPAKVFIFQGSGAGLNGALSAFTWTTNNAGDWITQTSADYYMQFRDMGFITQLSQSAGAVISVNGNANNHIYNCVFTGLSSSQTLFNCINFNGTNGGEESIVYGCDFTNFTGTAIICNSNLETVVIDSITINGGLSGTTGAACGVNIILGGAVQINNSDIIGCNNDLLINPVVSTVVASVFCVNTYFDNAFGSCIKITGAGATVRTKFEQCSFTVSANSSTANAVEVSSTYNYATVGMGLDFVNCNVLNTFGTLGVGTGFNITGAGDFRIMGCNIAAWATGIAVTPATANLMTRPQIQDNTIGNAGGYGVNTTGIVLNAGSFTYGQQLITNNNLSGNTTAITDSTTVTTTANNNRTIMYNVGYNPKSVVAQPTIAATTVAVWNSTGVDCTVYLKLVAAVTTVAVGGVTTGLTAATASGAAIPVKVAANQQIAITYASTAPTWIWVGS
jgi:hypothetical protein